MPSLISVGFLVSLSLVSLVTAEPGEELEEDGDEVIPNQNRTRISAHPVVLIVSYDGFRYDYFSKASTPHLDALKGQGVYSAYMKNEFPTKTFPNHQSVATGLHPESHGVVENSFFDPEQGKVLNVPDEAFWVYRDDVVPVWVLNEWAGHGRVSGNVAWPGACHGYGHNKTRPTHCVDYDPSVPFEARVDMALSFITNDTLPANMVFLYFEEPDELAHSFGPDSEEVRDMIERMDNVTGYLISRLKGLGIFKDVNVILLSDHGFEEVRQNHIINITSFLDPALYSLYGSTPTYLIQPHEGQMDTVYKGFEAISKNANFSVYTKETINGSKPYWFYQNNPRITPILLVADLGYAFDDYYGPNGTMSRKDRKYNVSYTPGRVYGTHGYDNHLMPMHPFFMAHGPAFRSGVEVDPFHNIDLFPLLCHIVNIPTPPNNGTLPRAQGLLFKRGFNLGSSVGWAVAAGVIIGLVLLFGIMSLMVARHRNQSRRHVPLIDSGLGYRFVNGSGDNSENNLHVVVRTEDGGSQPVVYKKTPPSDSPEHRALLDGSISDSSSSETLL